MHLKYKRNLIQTTVSPTLGSASMFFKASSLAAVIFGFLIIGAGADYLCKPEQIRWTATTGNKYKCFECPDCPARTQPSVPCGSSVPYGTPVHCIACELGKTYSDKYGKARCKPCTVCSKGKAVKKNCTLYSNTVCDSKCVEGYYLVPFIFTCFPCAECCSDGKDEKAKECGNYAKKCKVRSIPCANVPTKAHETTTDGRGPSTANSQKTSTTLKTAQRGKLQITMSTMLRTHETKPPTLSVPSTGSENDRQVVDGSVARESEEKNNVDTTLIIVAATCAVIAIVATLSTSTLIIIPAYKRRSNLDANTAEGIEMSQLKPSASHSKEQQNPVPILLSQLNSVALDAYERVWKRLDKIPEGTNKGDFRDVAKDFGLAQEDIWELEKEFKASGSGSPSRQLLEYLETRLPQLTVSEFVEVLQKPNIDRDDIGDILKDYLYFQVNQGGQINP